jgi:hypothetical protein
MGRTYVAPNCRTRAAAFCADDPPGEACAVRALPAASADRQSGTPMNATVPLAVSEQTS